MGLRGILNSVVHTAESIFHTAESNVGNTVKTAEKIVTTPGQLDSTVKSISARFTGNDPLEDITRSVARKAEDIAVRVVPAVVENTFASGIKDLGKNLFSKAQNFFDGAKSFVEGAANRIVDAGRSVINGTVEGLIGFGRSVFEGVGQTLTGIGEMLNPAPLAKVLNGDFTGAWNDIQNNFSKGASDVGRGLVKATVQALADTVIVALSSGVSALQTLVGLEPPSRALNQQEIAELKKVYGDTIDYSQIRLKEGFIGANQFLAPHTVGNTIYIPQGWLDSSKSDYQQRRNELITHETCHVWQYQNGGTDYISESLYNQAKGAISGGDRGAAYSIDASIKAGKKWSELNPEQQAHLIETAYGKGLFDNPNARFNLDDGTDITDYVRDAIKQVRQGQGAP